MTLQEIKSAYERIINSLNQRELKTAFDSLRRLAAESHTYLFQDELFEMQETYKQLLYYYVAGSTDPMRQKIFSELMASIYEITDMIMQKILSVDSPEMYYSIRRTLSVQPENITTLTDSIRSAFDIQNITHAESLLTRLFKALWTSSFLSDDDANSLQQSLLAEETNPDLADNSGFMTIVNCQIVSALLIGIQTYFDRKKLLLLFHATDSNDEEVRIRAYIGILITCCRYQHRIAYYPDIQYRMDMLSEKTEFNKTVYLIILRFILSRDTEKITAKMREEIVPEMMKLNPKINPSSSSKDSSPEFFDFEMNPEWIEKVENSPLGKKLEEFSQLQEEGADVMLFSFVNLKHFPFFNDISNWFLPFHKGLSHLSGASVFNNTLEITTSIGLMCNSDLYSFYFSMKKMREEGRLTMIEKLENHLIEWNQQKKADLQTRDDKTERLIGHYIQDLYRFYKLFPRRKEFQDIFTQTFDFHNLPIIKRYFSDKNDLLNIAEFYLRKNYFIDALVIYNRLTNETEGDEMLYQKKGYCYQMTGDYDNALDEYVKAEIINPDSKWLLRRIALCHRAAKNPQKALHYYQRLEKLDLDNLSVLLNIGSCYLEMKKYADAMKYYYKVDYLDHDSGKAWRPIAWCSFLIGKFEQAQNYYLKILSSSPGYQDYINAGHTEWALCHLQSAFDYYLKSIQTADNNFETFFAEFTKDIPELTAADVNSEEIPLMLDKLRYSV